MRMRMIVTMIVAGLAARAQRVEKAAALHPEQPRAERGDQRIADDLDQRTASPIVLAVAPSSTAAIADERDRDQGLQHGGGEGQHDAAPPGLLVGDQVRGDHRLAVTGPGGVENPVERRTSRTGPRPRCRRPWRRGSAPDRPR